MQLPSLANPAGPFEWGIAGESLAGVSGDRAVIAPYPAGALFAVIDGLGHGPEAARASAAAAAILENDAKHPAEVLFRRCHEGLRELRGAALSLAAVDLETATLTWSGIGNVEGFLLRADPRAQPSREALPLRGGILGDRLPPALRTTVHPIGPGDTLILASDGIRSGFADPAFLENTAQNIAEDILRRFARGTDDALVLVARYLGNVR